MRKLKLFSLLMLLLVSIGHLWADEAEYIITSQALAVTLNGESSTEWTITSGSFSDYDATKGAQTTANSFVITCPETYSNVTSIVVYYSTNKKSTAKISAAVGEQAADQQQVQKSQTNSPLTFSFSDSGDDQEITVSYSKNGNSGSLYIKKIVITYTAGGGTSEPTLSLDPTSVSVVASDVTQQTIALTASNFSPAVTTVTTGLYSNEGCTSAVTSGAWVKDITVNNVKTQVTFNVDNNTGAARQVWLKITASNGTKSADAILPISQAKYTEPTGTFNKYTGETLVEGDYVIVYETRSNAMKASQTANANRMDYAVVSPTQNKITDPDASLIWHIAPISETSYWTIYNEDAAKYIGSTSTNNQAKLLDGDITDNMKWTVAISDGKFDFSNVARVAANGNPYLRNNDNGTNHYGFACYANQTEGPLTLYKKALPTHAVTFTAAPTGGTVAVSAGSDISSGDQVEEGSTVTITPAASQYYRLVSVTKGGQAIEPVQGVYSFTMPTSDVAIVVTFELIPVTSVTLNKSALELVEGATETLSVTSVLPNTAQNTVTWSSTDETVATVTNAGVVSALKAGSTTIKATSTVSTSVFGSCALTVTAATGSPITILTATGGEVTASVDVADVLEGTSVTLTATPADGYSVSGWTVLDGNAAEITPTAQTANTFTFSMPDGEVTAEANFTHEEAVLKLHDANGESTFDSENTHYWKEEVTLPSTAATCSKTFMGWSVDADRSTAPELAKGASYTIPNKGGENHLYAVYADEIPGAETKVTDNIDLTFTEVSGTSYVAWASSKTGISGAEYTGVNAGGNSAIQFRSEASEAKPASGIISLTSGGKAKKVTITWNSNTADNRTLNVFGSNSAYTAVADLVDDNKKGTLLGTVVKGTSTELNITGEYQYIGLRSNSGAMYLDNIAIEWTQSGAATYGNYSTTCTAKVETPTISGVVNNETYTTSKTISLDCETEGAAIYYSLDGADAVAYSGSIEVNTYGPHTLIAYATKEDFTNSDEASVSFTLNLPFAKVSDLFTYLQAKSLTSLNDVTVTGVVTEIVTEYSSQHKNVSINIADDFDSNSPQLEGYRTKDATGVTAASIVAVGDKVTLKGNYTYYQSTTHQLSAGNTIEEYTAKELSSVTVGGTASKTAYSEEDNQFSFAGLTATANYSNTGYSKDVTNEVTWKANEEETYTVTEGGDVNVTATLGNVTSEPKVVAVTFTPKTVKSIRLEYASTYTFKGFELPKPRVYASYVEDIPEEEVTELLTDANYDTKSVYDKDVADNYTITVEYKSKETTYTVDVRAIYNTQVTAHSVADAIEIIKKSTYTSTSADPTAMYVHGVVSGVGSINSGKLGYYINDTESTDGQLQVYQGLYFESESFTNDNILAVGDEVIIEGHMLYFSSTTPELKLSPLVYLLKKALPTISVEDVDELEVGQADLDITELITKQGNGVVSLESGDLEKLTVDGLTLHAVGAGDVTVTANLAATDNTGSINYKANSTTFTVHVIAERTRYTVTFDANGADGGSAPEAIANQLEGAPVELPECTYTWAHHGFTGWKVINLSTSAEIEVENNQFTMPAANVKIQAQWEEIATTHIVFNVNGNTETVAAVDVPQAVEYSITQVTDGQNGYEFFGWAESEQAEDVEEAIATIERYTPEAGEASKTLYAVFKRVDEGAPKTDVLTAADLKATDTQYKDFSNVSKTSNAKYAGNSAKDSNGNIQLRSNNSNSGIVSTTSGGILKSVKINVARGSNTIDVYGSNTAYNAASDLYATGNNANQGTKIGSTSSTATINAEADYKFVGIRSNNGAIYLSSVEIVWQPKTTYYTTAPSAVYAVSYDLGEGAWAGEACDGANVKAGQTFDICESVPVREHYKFNGWTAGGNVVSGTITINAETAITAVWEPKVENDITYNAGTGSGSDAVVGNNEEGAEIVLPSAADKSLSKEGYDFVGWLYGGDLYEAGTIFEMPASAVTFVAQWKKQNITKMTLVTDVAQLVDGSKVVIVSKDPVSNSQTRASAIAGQLKDNKYLQSVTSNLTFNEDNTISYNAETAIELTLDKEEGGWALRNGDNYLVHSSGNQVKWQSDIAVWNISFSGNNATIKYSDNYFIQYNASSGSERFSAYSNAQNAVQLYASVTAVTENASISDLGYVEGDVIVVSSGATLTMDAPSAPASITIKKDAVVNVSKATEAGTVIVEKGAKLVIEEGGSVTTDEPLVLYTTLGKGTGTKASGNAPGSSSEIINAERLNATGDVFIEIELTQDAKASAGWYAFSVPFPVDAMNGVYYGDTKLTNEVGYAIMSHYGELRAKDEYAWKKFRGIMQPGVFYVITVGNTDYKTLRFKKVADEALVASSSVAVSPFPTQTGNNADGAWNGIGNPNLAISNLSTAVTLMQFYDHKTNTFIGRSHSVNLVVGSAFFIQYNGGETVSIPVGTTDYEGVLAPRREQKAVEEMIYEVQLTNVATGELEDNVFLTAREDATNEYEIGRDVAKLSMGTAKCAQMWVPAYGTKLCAADFQLVNDKAEYPLTLNAPSAGTYSISMVENDAATIYLTYEGSIIWNLSMSAYELTLEKGTTEGYGLLLNAKMPMTPTGVDEVQSDKVQCTKVVIDEHVYILRGGEMYDVTGKAVK